MKFDPKTHLLTPDGHFSCTLCKGTGKMKMYFDANKGDGMITCWECGGSGYYASQLILAINNKDFEIKHVKKERDGLISWIKFISVCKTCKGDQMKTPGGCSCEECGLEGMAPWGG